MLEFIQWVIAWVQVIPWLVMGASLVAALTPTPVDDGLVKKAYKPYGKSMILGFANCRMRQPSKTLVKTKVKRKNRKVKRAGGQKGV